jgi:hypothetical protein
VTSKRVAVAGGTLVAVATALAWYVAAARQVPEGQAALATLSAASLAELRADFNRDADKVRLILLLSPT